MNTMTTEQILSRYPAFLVAERKGRYVPWPGQFCVNEHLPPESIFGDEEPPPAHILQACINAERLAASQAQRK